MGFQKGNTHGNRFSSTNQPKSSGRKPRLYTQIAKQWKVSREEYTEAIKYVLGLSKTELEELMLNPETPIW